jgi:geranylgeranyl reductase family protein
MSEFDVVIVGAGPVGGYLGRRLAEGGLKVLMLEEHDEIGRPFQCAGLVTPAVMDRVALESTILSSVHGARIHSPAGICVKVGTADRIRTHVVCRKLFDEGVVRQAIDAGVALWLGSRPESAEVTDSEVNLVISRRGNSVNVTCKLLCGADGAHSWVRRQFRMGRPKEMMIGFQAEVVGYDGEEGYLDMYTGELVAPGLFAWAIPSGRSWRIGVWARPADLNGRSCEHLYDALLSHPAWAERFGSCKEVARYCGPLPCGIVAKPSKQRVALFGDAAGLCKPTTGGGIGPGFEQVDLMAQNLVDAVAADRLSDSQLKRIFKPLMAMKKEQGRARILRDLFLTDCDDEKLEKTFQTFAKPEVVGIINEVGEIEKPVPLGIRMLKEVPEFRPMAAKATWALLRG